ncbi:hypothetical protein [Winogradskyella sp. PE311]|uniref:hypothetical protein n=1 Tax=Winogradskyella sp. PE311 TaxID=3366943 RepID=UPI00398155A1
MNKGVTILLLFFAICTYGQKSTLIQNIDYRAKGLNHSLNKTGDSLILESDETIFKVQIFNSQFDKEFLVSNHKIKIPLHNIPVGRFVTEVKLPGKLVLITLIRHQPFINAYFDHANVNTTPKQATVVEQVVSLTQNKGNTEQINLPKRTVRFYWIVNHINKGHSSSKIMRLGEREIVERMIEQNKIDLKTKAGRRNKLTIWEVYDTSKFMRFKMRNSDYANAQNVDFFNTTPFYDTSF